jgi:hypothetical protein
MCNDQRRVAVSHFEQTIRDTDKGEDAEPSLTLPLTRAPPSPAVAGEGPLIKPKACIGRPIEGEGFGR